MKYYQTKVVLLPKPFEDKKYPLNQNITYLQAFEEKCNKLGDEGWKLIQLMEFPNLDSNLPTPVNFLHGVFSKENPYTGGTQLLPG